MRVMVLGGVHDGPSIPRSEQEASLARIVTRFGLELARSGHELVVCSPYPGSADVEALRGWAGLSEGERPLAARIELHCPEDQDVSRRVAALVAELGLHGLQPFKHPPSYTEGKLERTYSWMLSQLAALDRTDVLVCIGGNPAGSANLLLQLAATRRVPVLPLGQIGGAATAFLERNRFRLGDLLGSELALLEAPEGPDPLMPLVRAVAELRLRGARRAGPQSFFISYPRARPQEADFAETILRRRDVEVFRDDRDFASGEPVVAEMETHIRRADIFIAMWCAEYACSPWCYDELQLALDLRQRDRLQVAILCLDGTRIVPSRARELRSLPCPDRSALETELLKLCDRG